MRTFIVPALPNEDMVTYQQRVSGMAWPFTGSRELTIMVLGEVSLDGDKPAGSDFVEVLPPPVVPRESWSTT